MLQFKRKKFKFHNIKSIDHSYRKGGNKRIFLSAPKYIDYYYNNQKNYIETNKFIESLIDCVLVSERRVFIDFSKTELISAAAMLSFLAEVDILTSKSKFGVGAIAFSHPKNEKIESILNQVGFYDLLKKEKRTTEEYPDVSFWKFTSGVCSQPQLASKMLAGIKKEIETSKSKKLYRGFSEAMANSVEHAYLDDFDDFSKDEVAKWWTFAGINDKELVVVICDKGVGIPKTLPKTQGVSALKQIFNELKISLQNVRDSTYIKAATTLSKTRTGQTNRGKGLCDITSVIDNIGAGVLSIFSNKGRYIYNGKNKKIREVMRDYKSSVRGTIVEWSIPFEVDKNENN